MLPRHRQEKGKDTQRKWTDKWIDGGLASKQILFRIPCGCPIRGGGRVHQTLPSRFYRQYFRPACKSSPLYYVVCPFPELSRLEVPAGHGVTLPCRAMQCI